MEDDDRMVLVAVEAVDAILGVDCDRASVYLDMLWRALPIPMDAIAVATLADDLFHCIFPPVAALLALTMAAPIRQPPKRSASAYVRGPKRLVAGGVPPPGPPAGCV